MVLEAFFRGINHEKDDDNVGRIGPGGFGLG